MQELPLFQGILCRISFIILLLVSGSESASGFILTGEPCPQIMPAAGSHPDSCQSGAPELMPGKQDTSLILLVNRNNIIPLRDIHEGSFVFIGLGSTGVFASRIGDYLEMPLFSSKLGTPSELARILPGLEGYDRIIAAISLTNLPEEVEFRTILGELMQILESRESVIVLFGSPGQLVSWEGVERVDGLLLAEDNDRAQDLAAQAVFGAAGVSGRLSSNIFDVFPAGAGISTSGGLRLRFGSPEDAGLDGGRLEKGIDSLVNMGLAAGAFPGCRVLVATGGMVIVDRAWGYHTYAGRVAVAKNDLYDLASVTKITGPLPLYMKLVDEGRLDIDRPLSHYWDDWENRLFRRSNKEGLVLRDLLTHQAGIMPYINYWEQTLRGENYRRRWYRHQNDGGYNIELGSHLFLRDNFRKRVYRTIRRSELLSQGEYRYSCLPFIISPEVIAAVDGREYTRALYEDFYKPLGAVSLRYNPLDHFPAHRIVPTEFDGSFRRKLVHGYVHDEAAAVLGGVSGNAGLFSTAGDLAKLLQMYLNGGVYGGRRYLSQEVLDEFNRVQFPENNNRRGIGFDKPLLTNRELSPERAYPSHGASESSFGHSGFTGTFVWMDPEHDLLYIFLSNRVYPTRINNLLGRMNIRTEILQLVYDELEQRPEIIKGHDKRCSQLDPGTHQEP